MARVHCFAGAVWTGLALVLCQNALADTGSSDHSGSSITALIAEHQLLQAECNRVTEQINEQAKSVQDLERFSGEAEQVRSDIDEYKGIVKDMGVALEKRKIELDAAPRVSIVQQGSTPELVNSAAPFIAAGVGATVGLLLFVIVAVVIFLLFRWKPSRELGSETPGEATPVRSGRWFKRAILACLTLIVAGGLGALGWFLFPAKYESAGYFRVSIIDPAVWQSHAGTDFESCKRNMVEMITSPVVLGKAVEDRSIQGLALYRKNSVDPVQWLSDTLKVSGGSGELVRVSLRSEDPEGIKEIVDAVLVAFDREVIERARTEGLNDVESLEKKFKSYQTQILDKERTLYNLSLQLGTGDSSTAKVQYKMQVDSLDTLLRLRSDLQRQIADVEFKASLAKIQQDLDKKPSADPAPDTKFENVNGKPSKTPPTKKTDAEPLVTDPFGDLLRGKDSKDKAKTGSRSDNPFEEPAQPADAKTSPDIKPGAAANPAPGAHPDTPVASGAAQR
jgi:hypothetical protein